MIGFGSSPLGGPVPSQYIGALNGKCVLSLVNNNIVLMPSGGGNTTVVNGTIVKIPDAGIPLSAVTANLIVGQAYYAFLTATGVLEAVPISAASHAPQSGTGIEVKTINGVQDPSRALQGQFWVTTGPSFVNNAGSIFGVRSWYNDNGAAVGLTVSGFSTSANTPIIAASAFILTWKGDLITIGGGGTVHQNVSTAESSFVYYMFGPNGAPTSIGSQTITLNTTNYYSAIGTSLPPLSMSSDGLQQMSMAADCNQSGVYGIFIDNGFMSASTPGMRR